MTAVIDKNKMRDFNKANELVFKTFGIDSVRIEIKKFQVTNSQTQFVIEWTDRGVTLDATIMATQIKDKWVRSKYDVEFEAEQHERLKFIQNELYNQDDVNDEVFEEQEYDPARGYVEKAEKQPQQVEIDLNKEETE